MTMSQQATKIMSRIGFFLPLFLAFLLAADAAYACPQHSGSAGYRMKRTIARTAPSMGTTVIAYRAPISYRRCGDNLIDTRGARYVAQRGDRLQRNANYVAVRNGGQYKMDRTRYVAVRNADRYVAPRYVAVRRQPVYVESGGRYVAVRGAGPSERLVPISEIADVYDDDIQYVKVRRAPAVRYAAVRDANVYYEAPRSRYVAVRNAGSGCARPVAVRRCGDTLGTVSTRRVVLRDDVDAAYTGGAKYVAVREEIDDDDMYDRDVDYAGVSDIDEDDDYVGIPAAAVNRTKYIDHDDAYLTTREVESPYVRQVAVRAYPETYRTRTISYAPVSYYNDDIDDLAYLDGGGATDIAYDDIENACLRPVVYREAPTVVSTREVGYVPMDDVDEYAFHGGSAETYIEMPQPVSTVSYVPAETEIDTDARYIAADHNMDTVSYVAVDNTEFMDAEPVSYMAVNDVDDIDTEIVSYVPAQRTNFRTVSYVPVDNSYDVDTTYVAAEEYCPMDVAYAGSETVYFAESPTVVVQEMDSAALLGLSPTVHRIARTLGYNEGFEDGLDDVQDGDDYEPSDGGAQGYKREYGDKTVYRGVFRSAYLEGYQAGYKALDAAL